MENDDVTTQVPLPTKLSDSRLIASARQYIPPNSSGSIGRIIDTFMPTAEATKSDDLRHLTRVYLLISGVGSLRNLAGFSINCCAMLTNGVSGGGKRHVIWRLLNS